MNTPDAQTFVDPNGILFGLQKCYNMWVLDCYQKGQTLCDADMLLTCVIKWFDVMQTLGGGAS